jgi:hypothetical protein
MSECLPRKWNSRKGEKKIGFLTFRALSIHNYFMKQDLSFANARLSSRLAFRQTRHSRAHQG